MKVKLLVEFDVTSEVDGDELSEAHAKSAASQAVYDYLALVKVSGYTSEADEVTVHVDGYGACEVKLGEDHE